MTKRFPQRLTKIFVSVSLSAALLMTGTLAIPAPQASAMTSSKAQSVIATAKQYLNKPYKYGAALGQTRNFDCSSFVWTVFKRYGKTLPRTAKEQSKVGTYVSKANLKPGDLVFFYSPIHHVGIYIGNGKMIHTYGSPGVTITDINKDWWKKNYATARRVM
ncbi:Cell wall-associated hydrolase, NlpC family [Paenibacillus sp. UNCCL117]|uniref:C40 family peptidase n=1 Tax=unclassified Paenibacillus TaxID=185978 RepID=UPI000888983E|nr:MULTISPECIES: C40 family peptidase [unclassified Paenibacillus]SDC53871.1 Cell wall-associated hydrolase, NlpC family [Paenibacillus sp. cl123]SFW11128.1 Cell wall-associated hydrolase, NlpC family [Paenibacillus sp. UNCCL117]